jgi:hypothetical protein
MEMKISVASSPINGFKNWANDHLPSSNDDDKPGGATPIALAEPPAEYGTLEDPQHRPWIIPGVGGSF